VDFNPNYAVKANQTYVIPYQPGFISDIARAYSLVSHGGSIGILFDGASVYSAYGGPSYGPLSAGPTYANDYTRSAPYAEGYSFDFCGEHASSSNSPSYHAHVPPPCLLKQLGATPFAQSPQIGWAADGFPIYGPLGPDGVFIKRCTEPSSNASFCADQCGGLLDASQKFWADGYVYRYFIMGPYTQMNTTADN